jgi:hypothetical protein
LVVHGGTTVSPTPPAAELAASRGPSVAAAGAAGAAIAAARAAPGSTAPPVGGGVFTAGSSPALCRQN